MMEQLYTRPDKRGQSQVYVEAEHPRARNGQWVKKAYHKATQPPIRGPRSLARVPTPINRRLGKAMTRRQNWKPIPWSRRTWVGKVIGLLDGSWRRERKTVLRRRAKQASREGGFR